MLFSGAFTVFYGAPMQGMLQSSKEEIIGAQRLWTDLECALVSHSSASGAVRYMIPRFGRGKIGR